MIKLNLGNPFFSIPGYVNSAEVFKADNQSQIMSGDEILQFPWPIADNSVSAVKIFFKLESLCDDKQFFAVMRELHRVCIDGALVEIRSQVQENLDSAGLSAKAVTRQRVNLLNPAVRQAYASDVRFACLVPQLQGVNFRVANESIRFNETAQAELSKQAFADDAAVQTFVKDHAQDVLYVSYFLNAIKDEEHEFVLATVPGVENFTLRAVPEAHEQFFTAQVRRTGAWELSETMLVSQLLKGMTKYHKESNQNFYIANIGANIGWYSVLACMFSDLVHVDAFEPNPEAIDMLHHNISLADAEGRITVHPVALSRTKGTSDFYVDERSSVCSSCQPFETKARDFELKKIEIQTDTMDNTYLNADPTTWPEFILMDVEGHEQYVVDGAEQMFARGYRPLIMTEFNPILMKSRDSHDYYKTLCEKLGYSVYALQDMPDGSACHLVKASVELLDEKYAELSDEETNATGQLLNLLFVPEWMDIANIKPKA